jgi:hypothetical protein
MESMSIDNKPALREPVMVTVVVLRPEGSAGRLVFRSSRHPKRDGMTPTTPAARADLSTNVPAKQHATTIAIANNRRCERQDDAYAGVLRSVESEGFANIGGGTDGNIDMFSFLQHEQ